MFLAGADGQTAELRPPSIKGMLRFWWRAAQAGVTDFKQREAAIFGSGGENGGRSSFSLQVMADNLEKDVTQDSLEPRPWPKGHSYQVHGHTLNILEYLAYGTYKWDKGANVLVRQYIKPGFEFELKVRLFDATNQPEVLQALQLFCRFGTLGAKSRNGYGSFQVVKVESSLATSDSEAQAYLSPDKGTMDSLCKFGGPTEFSAFSKQAKLYKTKKTYSTWHDCLAELAFAYRKGRLSLNDHYHCKQRQYIGSPIVVNRQQLSDLDRRAKPYFLRVHKQNDKFEGLILYLPSHYLPDQYCKGLGVKETTYNGLNLSNENDAFRTACDNFNTSLSADLGVVF
jgi:CRISPR-associated protein Cmr1